MQKITFFSLLIIGLFCQVAYTQNASLSVTDCANPKVTVNVFNPATSPCPTAVGSKTPWGNPPECLWITWAPVVGMKYRMELERKTATSWVNESNAYPSGDIFTFTGLTSGVTYRVTVYSYYCLEASAYNSTCTINYGKVAISSWYGETNEVTVGSSSIIDYELLDVDGSDLSSIAWDEDESIILDASNSLNYDRYWVAIFELTGAMRYCSDGWTFTTDPIVIDLQEVWGGCSFDFEPGNFYRVQFAIMNPCMSSWINLDTDFYICPTGTGCRYTASQSADKEITFYPNPVADYLHFKNLDRNRTYSIQILDISGRLMLNSTLNGNNNIDLSSLENGIYVVKFEDNNKLYNHKIIVSH